MASALATPSWQAPWCLRPDAIDLSFSYTPALERRCEVARSATSVKRAAGTALSVIVVLFDHHTAKNRGRRTSSYFKRCIPDPKG